MLNSLFCVSFTEVLSWVGYALIAVLILLVMITVHEFGHYIAGKLLHFKINEFSIGFGTPIYSKQKSNGERFSVRVIPLGGYCAFEGEDEDGNDNKEAFNNQKPYKRLIVLAMGAVFNFLLAFLVILLMFFTFGQSLPKVNEVLKTSDSVEYSEEYLLQEGDLILSVEGKSIYLSTDLTNALGKKELNEFVNMEIVRNNERISVKVLIRKYINEDSNGNQIEKIGLGIIRGADSYRFGFFETIGRVFVYCFKLAIALIVSLGQIIVGAIGINQIGGPITTIVETTKIVSYGLREILEITAFIGVNLAVFNLLPIPSLDGSRITFTLIEMVRKKPMNKKIERTIHAVGLMTIFIFVILIDILHFIL